MTNNGKNQIRSDTINSRSRIMAIYRVRSRVKKPGNHMAGGRPGAAHGEASTPELPRVGSLVRQTTKSDIPPVTERGKDELHIAAAPATFYLRYWRRNALDTMSLSASDLIAYINGIQVNALNGDVPDLSLGRKPGNQYGYCIPDDARIPMLILSKTGDIGPRAFSGDIPPR
jgi:hypothetical protein